MSKHKDKFIEGDPILLDGKLIPQDPANGDFIALVRAVQAGTITAPLGLVIPDELAI